MHGVRSGRSAEEAWNAPEQFLIDVVLLEPDVEFTVGVETVEIRVFDDANVDSRRVAHKALAIIDGELRASNGLVYPMRLMFSKARTVNDLWVHDYVATVALVSKGGTAALPDYYPPESIRLGLRQVG